MVGRKREEISSLIVLIKVFRGASVFDFQTNVVLPIKYIRVLLPLTAYFARVFI